MKPLVEEVSDLFSRQPQALADPYRIYRRLLREAPVFDWGPAVIVSRFSEVESVLRNAGLFSNNTTTGSYFKELLRQVPEEDRGLFHDMVEFERASIGRVDSPDHLRIRRSLARAFTPQRIAELRAAVHAMSATLIAQFEGEHVVDMVERYAFKLPLMVICELMGMPASPENLDALHRWSTDWFGFKGNITALRAAHKANAEFSDFIGRHLAERRANPGPDLLSTIAREGSELSEHEQIVTALIVLFAGHETTTNMIGSGLLALLSHPSQLELLRREPARVGAAVEEFLRYEPPTQTMMRLPVQNTAIGGVPVSTEKNVICVLAAANRDPLQHEDPDRFDITRDAQRHLSFGAGPHICIGASLARLEGEIAFTMLLECFPRLELIDEPRWNDNYQLRGLRSLSVRLH
jgi:cytochrome P450